MKKYFLLIPVIVFCLFAVAAPQAHAAIALVQSTSSVMGGGTSPVTVTFGATTAAGDTILVWTTDGVGSGLKTTVKDNAGNTYASTTAELYDTSCNQAQELFYAKNIAATSTPLTVTVTFSSVAPAAEAFIYEYSGLSTTTPLDATATMAMLSVANASTSAKTLSWNPDLAFSGFVGCNSAGTAGANYGLEINDITDDLSTEDWYTASGSIKGVWTNALQESTVILSTFKAATFGSGIWTPDSGSWSISSNQLVVTPAAGASVQIHVAGVSQTNGVIEFKVQSSAVGSNTGNVAAIVRENSGPTNWYDLAVADFLNQRGAIAKTIANAYSTLATGAYTFSANSPVDLRGSASGTALASWVNGGDALSTTDSSLSGAGNIGIAASSTNGSATFAIDDFAFYTSPIITMNNVPVGGSWSVENHSGTVLGCQTGSTWNLSTYNGQVPIDYDNGGGTVAVWASSTSCSPSVSPTQTYPSSGYATDIFGGDTYSYTAAGSSTPSSAGGAVVATSSIVISAAGAVSD